jgi:hypothetical protein
MAARVRILVIAPGGNRITNRWPSVRFEEIAKRWVDDVWNAMKRVESIG